jgi:hypothetical protein
MLSAQLLTGGVDVTSSFTEISSLESQLDAVAEMAQEELAERGLLLPGRAPNFVRLPPPQ